MSQQIYFKVSSLLLAHFTGYLHVAAFEVVPTTIADCSTPWVDPEYGYSNYFSALRQPLLVGDRFAGEETLQATHRVLYETLTAFSHFTFDNSFCYEVFDSFKGVFHAGYYIAWF